MMRIAEDLIRPDGWQHEWHRLRVNLLYSAGWLGRVLRDFLQPFDITPKQYNILRILRWEHPAALNIQEVRARMIDPVSDASRLIDRLAQRGWVDKQASSTDKRNQQVVITDAGLALLSQIDAQMAGLDQPVQTLTADEARQLNALLIKMRGEAQEG